MSGLHLHMRMVHDQGRSITGRAERHGARKAGAVTSPGAPQGCCDSLLASSVARTASTSPRRPIMMGATAGGLHSGFRKRTRL